MSNHDELLSSLLGTAKELKQAEERAANRPAIVQQINVGGPAGGSFEGAKMFASGILVAVAIIWQWSWVEPMALPYFSWIPWLQVACVDTQGGEISDSTIPNGNPLNDPRTVVTQGYGVGSHAPATSWGGQDIAIDADGDAKAEGESTRNVPVYATHSGTVRVTLNSWPGGNCVFVSSSTHRTTYCHLNEALVADGATVTRGQQIGKVGSTGNSSGPHLHYEVWDKTSGTEVNVNPAGYGMLEPLTVAAYSKNCLGQPIPPGFEEPGNDDYGKYEAVVWKACEEFNVPRNYASAIYRSEGSHGDPTIGSSAGAQGLMQIMPATGAGIAVELGVSSYNLHDPETNARFGCYYLSQKLTRYGVPWAFATYNWGPSGVDGFLERHPEALTMKWSEITSRWGGEIPLETRGYVVSVLEKAGEEV